MANIICTTFSISSGSFDLSNDTLNCSSTWTHTGGTFNGNTGNLFATTYTAGSSGVLYMGNGTWQANSTGTVWNVGSLTFNANSSTIAIATATSTSVTFAGGNKTYNDLILNSSSGNGTIIISGNNIFNNVSSLRTTAYTISLTSSSTTTVNNWLINGTSSNSVTLNSTTTGIFATLSQATGTVSGQYLKIQDNNAIGGAIFDGRFTTTNNLGNNLGWLFDNQRYWVGGTNIWDTTAGTKWANTSGGIGGSNVPTLADDVYFDANSGSGVITISASNTQNLSFNSFTGTIQGSNTLNLYGNLFLTPNVSNNYTGTILFAANGNSFIRNIDANNISLTNPLTFNGTNGVWNLNNDLLTTNNITLTAGTLISNSKNITSNTFITTGSLTKKLVMNTDTAFTITSTVGGTVWDANTTGLTISAATSTTIDISGSLGSNSITFASPTGGAAYGTLLFSNTISNGTITLTGTNSFYTLNSQRTTSYTFNLPGSRTTTVTNWLISGSSGNYVNVGSANNIATLSRNGTTGTINADWLILANVSAIPVATLSAVPRLWNWALGENSTFAKANNVTGVALFEASRKIAAMTSGSGSFVVPTDWNPNDNNIILVGGGGGGSGFYAQYNPGLYGGGAGGGGGGATVINNLVATSGSSINYAVGSGGTAGGTAGVTSAPGGFGGPGYGRTSTAGSGGTTSFGPQSATGGGGGAVAAISNVQVNVTAGAGGTGTYSGGSGGGNIGPNDLSGNYGAAGGGGGGGAAGLTSNGGNGGGGNNATSPLQYNVASGGGGAGGEAISGSNASGSTDGAGGSTTTLGGNGGTGVAGVAGKNFYGILGSGGGAGGPAGPVGQYAGLTGGLYGGGGSGARMMPPDASPLFANGTFTGQPGGVGGGGLILITYSPYTAPGSISNSNYFLMF